MLSLPRILKSDDDFTYWSGDWNFGGNINVGVMATFEDGRRVPEAVPEKFENFFVSLPAKDESFREAVATYARTHINL